MSNEDQFLKEVKKPTDLKRVLEFEVPRERVEREIHEIIDGIRREVALPGFRRGKAPLDLVRARFAETARKEAIEKLIPQAYRQALKKEALEPILPAEISGMEYGSQGPLRFRAEIELRPVVRVGEYKGVEAKREVKPVEESEIDREIEGLRERLARFEEFDRASEAQDTVVADYWRLGAEGNPVKGSKVSAYPFDLAGEGLLPEFKQALTGVRVGEKKTVEVTYPADFPQEDLRGKKLSFLVDVKRIGRRVLPEVNEEFAKTLQVESIDVLRRKVKEGLEKARVDEAEAKLRRDVLNAVVTSSDFEVPDGLVNMALDSIMESYGGKAGEGDAAASGKAEEMRERLRPLAVNVVKEQFIIDDIAEREKLTVDDAEIDNIVEVIAGRTGLSLEEVRRRAAESEEMARWRRDIIKNKVLDLLVKNAAIEE
jgi:trigger factor